MDDVLAADPRMKRFRIEEKKARDAKKNNGKAGGASSAADLKAKKEAEEAAKIEEAKKAEEAKKTEADDKVSSGILFTLGVVSGGPFVDLSVAHQSQFRGPSFENEVERTRGLNDSRATRM